MSPSNSGNSSSSSRPDRKLAETTPSDKPKRSGLVPFIMSTRSRQYQGGGSSTKKPVTPQLFESPSSTPTVFERAYTDSPTPLQRKAHGSRSLLMKTPQISARRSKNSVQTQPTRPARSSRSQKPNLQNNRPTRKSPRIAETRTSGSKIRKTGQIDRSSMTSHRRSTRFAPTTNPRPQDALANKVTATPSTKGSIDLPSATNQEDKPTSEPTQPSVSFHLSKPSKVNANHLPATAPASSVQPCRRKNPRAQESR